MLGSVTSCLYMYVQLNVTVRLDNVRARVYECREAHMLIKQSRNGEVYGKVLSETRRLSR